MKKEKTKGMTLDKKFPDISKEEIMEYIGNLSESEQKVFYKRFGKNLDEFNHGLSDDENTIMIGIYVKINTYFSSIKRYKNFLNDKNINKDNLKKDIGLLSENVQNVVIKLYGKNLDKFNENNEILDLKVINGSLNELENRRYLFDNFEKDFSKTIKYCSDYSIDDVKRAISKMKVKDVKNILKVEQNENEKIENLNSYVLAALSNNLGVLVIRDIYSDFEYSKEYIDKFISELNILDKLIVQKVVNKNPISRSEYARYKDILKIIKKQIKNDKNKETIYNLFSDYSREEINETINRLNETDRQKIKLRYGEDLDNPIKDANYTKEDGEYFVKTLLPKFNKMLNDKDYKEVSNISVKVKIPLIKKNIEKVEVHTQNKVGKGLNEMFSDINIEDLKILVSILPSKLKKVIYLKHSEELTKYNFFDHGSIAKYSRIYDEAIMKLDEAADLYKKGIKHLCKINEQEFLEKLSNLDETSLNLLKRIHGENLDKTLPLCILNPNGRVKYIGIIEKLNHEEEKEKIVNLEKKSKDKLKERLLDEYKYLFKESLSEKDIEYLIDVAMDKYKNEIEIERYILKTLYEYLSNIITNTSNIIEKVYFRQ